MKPTPGKGNPGYLDGEKKKKRLLLAAFVLVIAALLITASVVGGTAGGFIRMAGVLMVIPAANTLVNVIAMAPYRSGDGALAARAAEVSGGCRVLSELVITNTDGPSVSVPCAVIGEGAAVVYMRCPADREKAVKLPTPGQFGTYLERRMRISELELTVTAVREEEAFLAEAAKLTPAEPEWEARVASALLANSF